MNLLNDVIKNDLDKIIPIMKRTQFAKRLINNISYDLSMAFVYITCKDKKEAKKISKYLLEKRLIACANIFPIESMYRWEGKIVEEKEIVLLTKTITKNYEKIKKEVKKIHSYSIPCICLLKSESNKEYGLWVKKEVR